MRPIEDDDAQASLLRELDVIQAFLICSFEFNICPIFFSDWFRFICWTFGERKSVSTYPSLSTAHELINCEKKRFTAVAKHETAISTESEGLISLIQQTRLEQWTNFYYYLHFSPRFFSECKYWNVWQNECVIARTRASDLARDISFGKIQPHARPLIVSKCGPMLLCIELLWRAIGAITRQSPWICATGFFAQFSYFIVGALVNSIIIIFF